VVQSAGPGRIAGQLAAIRPGYLVIAWLLLLLGAVPGSEAWAILARVQGLAVSFTQLLRLNMVGFFFNSYLPTGLGGHMWKGFALARLTGRAEAAAASTVMERITAFGSIILLGLISLPPNARAFEKAGMGWGLGASAAVVAGVFLAGILLLPRLLRLAARAMEKSVPGFSLSTLSQGVELYGRHPGPVAASVLVTTLSQLTEAGAYWLVLVGMGLQADFWPLLTLVPLLRFINHVPLFWNSVGAQDLAMVLFWQGLGLGQAQALSVSVVMHLLRLMVGAAGGLVYAGGDFRKRMEEPGD
jgi:hypothetical protein